MIAAGCVLMAGCAGPSGAGDRFSYVDQEPYYGAAAIGYAVSGGIINTAIRGQPFAGAPANPEAIAALMRMPGWHPQAQPTTRPDPTRPANNHRLVLVFHPARGFPESNRICGQLDRYPVGPPARPVRLHGAFCAGTEPAAEAFGTGQAAGPHDPAFAEFLNRLLAVMLPPSRREFPDRKDWLRRR